MAKRDIILADSIKHIPHLAAWDLAFDDMQGSWDISKLLIYLIDTVDLSALEALAWQYDVLGNKGYNVANTDLQKRAIIKKALELHRYKGTVWSLKEALKSVGYGEAVLTEGDDDSWANFSLVVEMNGRALNAAEIDILVRMINEYKPERCTLVGILYKDVFSDSVATDDLFSLEPLDQETENIYVGKGHFHDGTYNHDGSIDRSTDTDSLIWTIL
jgi:phage tail P2-like protein